MDTALKIRALWEKITLRGSLINKKQQKRLRKHVQKDSWKAQKFSEDRKIREFSGIRG